MNIASGRAALLVALSAGIAACGGGSTTDAEAPVNIDYSTLKVAASQEDPLTPAVRDDEVLEPLRNGVRMSISNGLIYTTGVAAPDGDSHGNYSGTTVQVDGVDEADLVKYDGRYIYTVRPEVVPASSILPVPGLTRNVLKIVRTDPATAGTEVISEFNIEGEQTQLPQIYQLQADTDDGAAGYLAAVSTNSWLYATFLAGHVPPNRTTVQLLDVRDPRAVSQAWKIEMDGWLQASRKIGDTLYLVTSYWPEFSGLTLPADSIEKREANERRIRSSGANELLPSYSENSGTPHQLAKPEDCFIAADAASNDANRELTVITALSLSERRIKDVACLSTNIRGIYMSRDSLYVAGEGTSKAGTTLTVFHKFGLDPGSVSYRATGAAAGRIGWRNAPYFMDEYQGTLRVLTQQSIANGTAIHQLTVLQEAPGHKLQAVSLLPSPEHPAPIGKPGEDVQAVRFVGERAYVVTARLADPLYVIDLADPRNPFIAGALEIPGFSTYLRPVGPAGSELLLAVGQQTNADGTRQGVKVELFDVQDIQHPLSIGAAIFGGSGSTSDAINDPHALTFLPVASDPGRYRLALPINVFDTPNPGDPSRFLWSYSGWHLLEVTGIGSDAAHLDFHGVIKTAVAGNASYPPYVTPNRSVMHDDSVFVIHGDSIASSLWRSVGE